jgi:hypothetical protein
MTKPAETIVLTDANGFVTLVASNGAIATEIRRCNMAAPVKAVSFSLHDHRTHVEYRKREEWEVRQ